MQLSRLSAIQKRILDWQEFLNGGGAPTAELKQATEESLASLRALVGRAWREKVLAPADEKLLPQLLARLELLNEESRVRIGGATTIKKAGTFAHKGENDRGR